MTWLWLCATLALGASEDRFQDVLREVRAPTFSDQQLDVVRSVAATERFTASQAAAIITTFAFDRDQITAARLLAPGLEDPENVDVMLAAITSQPDRQRAAAMLVLPSADASAVAEPPDACTGGGWMPSQRVTLQEERYLQLDEVLGQQGIASSRLEMLRRQLKGEPRGLSPAQVLGVLRHFPEPASRVEAMALLDPWVLGLTGDQLGALVAGFELPHERWAALTIARHWLVDLDQAAAVRAALPRDGSLKVGESLLRDATARSPLLGTLHGQRLVVVVDGSSAMSETLGERTVGDLVRCDVLRALGQLRRGQRFTVVVASALPQQPRRGIAEATPEGLTQLDAWWAAQPLVSEPSLLAAVDTALTLDPDVVWVLTATGDLRLSSEEALRSRQARLAGVTVHTTVLQLGATVPASEVVSFAADVARVSGGRSRVVGP